jgi:ABC transporter substrate binding protein
MRLIGLAIVITVSVGLGTFAAEAQPARTTTPRLCFLTFDPRTPQVSRFHSFFQGLRDLGYVDGQTITIDYLSAGGQGERFPALAADCLRLKADIIVVTTTPAAQAAKNATRTIPIVMIPLGDPVGTGLVASLARPGGECHRDDVHGFRALCQASGTVEGGCAQNLARARALVSRRPDRPRSSSWSST